MKTNRRARWKERLFSFTVSYTFQDEWMKRSEAEKLNFTFILYFLLSIFITILRIEMEMEMENTEMMMLIQLMMLMVLEFDAFKCWFSLYKNIKLPLFAPSIVV
jgi:hypothetical protein